MLVSIVFSVFLACVFGVLAAAALVRTRPTADELLDAYALRRGGERALALARVILARPDATTGGAWAEYLRALNARHARLDRRDSVEWRPPVAVRASTKPRDVWGDR